MNGVEGRGAVGRIDDGGRKEGRWDSIRARRGVYIDIVRLETIWPFLARSLGWTELKRRVREEMLRPRSSCGCMLLHYPPFGL